MGRVRPHRGHLPTELGFLIDMLEDFEQRIDNLEGPDVVARTGLVARVEAALADIEALNAGLQARLDDYFATVVPGLVASAVSAAVGPAVSSAVSSALSGHVTLDSLTVNGDVNMPGVRSRNISSVANRVVVWTGGNGEMGNTA